MNKLFKVIWSKSKQCYIVVSEVAKNTTGKKKIAVASVLAALTVGAQVATVQAAIQEGTVSGGATVALGNTATATNTNAIAVGKNVTAAGNGAITIGTDATTAATSTGAIAMGSSATATGAASTAIGSTVVARQHGSTAIGSEVNVDGYKSVGLGFGITSKQNGTTAIGYLTRVFGNQAVAIGSNMTAGEEGVDTGGQVAIGYSSSATGQSGIGIGSNGTSASGHSTIALGNTAKASGSAAIAIGKSTKAELDHSVALGEGSATAATDGTATTGYLTNDAVNNSGNGIIAVGSKREKNSIGGVLRRVAGVASGSDGYDAVNVLQLKALRNATVSTVTVVDGATTTDLAPITDETNKDAHKLKLVAGKNITLTANGNAVTIASKSEVSSITSSNADAVTVTTGADGKVSVTPNLASDVNAAGDANKLVTAGKVKEALADKVSTDKLNEELGKKANAADVANLTNNKLDKASELHVVKGTYAVATDGSVTLNKADGEGTVKNDEAVKITGLASKAKLDELKTAVDAKADKSYVDGELGKKADAATVTAELAKKADAATVNAELAKKANAADIANLTTDKVNKTDELHVKKGTYNIEADGRVVLKKVDGTGADKADEDVIIAGVAKQSDINTIKADLATKVGNDAFEAEKNRVNGELAKKLDETTFEKEKAKLASKDDINGLKDVLAGKVDKDTIDKFIKANEKKVSAEELNDRINDAQEENTQALNAAKTELGNKITEATKNKLDKSDELHVIAKEYAADQATGTVTIEQENANNEKQADKQFTITGLATKKDVTDLTTKVDAKAEKSYVDEELGKKADATTVANLGTDKVDKTAELHVVKGDYAVAADGTVTLNKADGTGTVKADEAVKITDVASKAKLDDVDARVTEQGEKIKAAEGRLDTAEEKIKTAEGKITAAEGRLDTAEGRLDTADGKIKAAEDKIKGIEDNIRDNIATNASVAEKLNNLKDQLGNDTALSFAGDETKDANDAATEKVALNLKDGVLKVKGAEKEIKTTAKGDTITVGLSDEVKEKLAKVEKLGDTTADGRDGANGTAKDTGLTGKDGLNGKTLTDKVNALRNGEAGSVVYTDDKGNRLSKANNGKYYLPTELDEHGDPVGTAQPVDDNDLRASVMNPGENGGPTTLSNLKDGKVAKDSKDAVTGNQLHKAKDEIATALGGGAGVNEDGSFKAPSYTVKDKTGTDKTVNNVGDALSTINERLNEAHTATTEELDNLKKLKGLDPEGENKIKELAGQAVDVKGDKNITITSTMENGVKTFHATLSEKITFGKHDANDPDGDHSDDPGVEVDGHEGTIVAGNPDGNKAVKIDGKNGKVTVGNPDNGKGVELDAENGRVKANEGTFGAPADKDGVPTANEVATTTINDKGLSTVYKDKDGKESKVEVKEGRLTAGAPVDKDGNPTKEGTATSMDRDKGFSVTSKDKDGNVSTVGINNGRVSAGDPVDKDGIPTNAGSATSMDKDGFSLATKDKDGKVSKVDIKNGGITAGAPVDANGVPTEKNATAVSMGKDGFSVISTDENGKPLTPITIKNGKISGLQPGTADTDVATVGQVKEAIGKTAEVLEKTAQRVDEVGAHSAALAALNPLSYDPLRKSQIMAGIGSYSGNQALALGLAHYANENLMVTAGFTMGSGKSMANLGATYRFGSGEHDDLPERYKGGPISSVYVMQDEIAALKAENARKDAENAEMKAQIKMLMQRMGMA